MTLKKFFSNLWDKYIVDTLTWVMAVLFVIVYLVVIALAILIPIVLSVGGICFVIWFFFQCLGGVI